MLYYKGGEKGKWGKALAKTYVTMRVSVVVSLGQIWADFFPAKLKN